MRYEFKGQKPPAVAEAANREAEAVCREEAVVYRAVAVVYRAVAVAAARQILAAHSRALRIVRKPGCDCPLSTCIVGN